MTWRLVAERQDFREQHEYTLLVSGGEPRSTISLSVSSTLPWAARGMQRWSSQDLLRVDGFTLSVQQAIACVDFVWRDRNVSGRLVDVCLMSTEIEARGIEIDDNELQEHVDAFRRGRKLYDVAATERWMCERGLTQRMFEEYVRQQALIARLRHAVTAGRIEGHSAEHAARFDTVRVSLAFGAAAKADERGVDFFAAVAAGLRDGSVTRVETRTLRRCDCSEELAAALFAEGPGARGVLVPVDGQPALACVLERRQAMLDDATREAIERQLFADWLAERRHAARIDWNWGKTTAEWLGSKADARD